MKGKAVFVILLIVAASLIVYRGLAFSPTTVFVDPVKSNVNVGSTFTVSIKLTGGIDVFTIQFYLGWYAPALDIIGYKEGDFLSQGVNGTTQPVFKASNASGSLKFWNTRLGQKIGGVTGSGTIVTATFLVKTATGTGLFLYEVHLLSELLTESPIGFIKDGYVNVNPPMFHVAPSSITDPTLKPGAAEDSFTVNLTLTNVVEATKFAFTLYYNSTLLNATKLSIVPFLNKPFTNDTKIDNTLGFLWVNVTSSASTGATGSGPVANVTFKVLAVGQTLLKFNVTNLSDSLANLGSPPFQHRPTTEDGYFSNIPAGHDVAVSRITALPTTLDVGGTVQINATIVNLGAFNESTVYVTVSDDPAKIIENRTGISINSLESKTLVFTWNTAGLAGGSYTIRVTVGGAPSDTKPSNNVLDFGPITLNSGTSGNLYLYLGAGVVVAAVIIILALYFLRFRKPKTKTTST